MDLVPRPTSRDWLFLVDIVLCIGAFCHSQLNLTTDYFLNSALNRITSEHLEAGSLTLVQAYCLLSDISHKRDKPNAGSVYMGVALRMAIGLGLHLELPLWKITPFEAELRRRVWWTAIALDASASMTLGRPIVEPTVTPSVHPVRNVNDCSFTTATIAPPDESSEPTTYTAIKYHSQFHAYTTRIYQRITANVPLCAAEALTLDQELLDWLGTVPACFKPNRDDSLPHWHSFGQYRLQWRHGNLRMILHRGAFLSLAISNSPLWDRPEQPNLEIESCRLCLVAAAETISSIGDLCDRRQTRSRLEGWYALHFLLHPTYIILVALYCDPTSSQRAVWESIVDRACHVLQYCPKDPAAEKCLRMIRLLRSSLASGAATGELHDANAQLIDMQESSSWIAMIGLQSQQASNTLSMADLSTLNSFWNERGQQ